MTTYPNARNKAAGAIPVYLSASPKAMPIAMNAESIGPASGPIPIYFVTAPTKPPYPNDQGNPASAIPVVISASPKAMPVWETGVAPPAAPVNTVLPAITPHNISVVAGATLTVDDGTWTNSPTIFYYGWTRSGVGVPGANTNTYLTSNIDATYTMAALVQAANVGAPGIAVRSSNAVIVSPAVPVNTVLPAVTPSGTVVHGATLTTDNGTWSGDIDGYHYTWKRNGTNIPGTQANTYVTTVTDVGTAITAAVQGTFKGSVSPGAISNAVSVT